MPEAQVTQTQPVAPGVDSPVPASTPRRAVIEFKDVVLLLASIALGVMSAAATTTLQSRYAAKQALIERQTSALSEFAVEFHRVFNRERALVIALARLAEDFVEDSKLGMADAEQFSKNWIAGTGEFVEHIRTDGLKLEGQWMTIQMLFSPNALLTLRGSKHMDAAASPVGASDIRGLRRAIQKNLPLEEKMRIALLLARAADPWAKAEMKRLDEAQNQVNRELQEYFRSIER